MREALTTWKGFTSAIDPATTEVINAAAPISSPIAMLELLLFMAAKVEKISGLPFPSARNVTPASVSLKLKACAMVLRLTEKKSPATRPRVVKRMASHKRMSIVAKGFAPASRQ
jgi:hypothetical protein